MPTFAAKRSDPRRSYALDPARRTLAPTRSSRMPLIAPGQRTSEPPALPRLLTPSPDSPHPSSADPRARAFRARFPPHRRACGPARKNTIGVRDTSSPRPMRAGRGPGCRPRPAHAGDSAILPHEPGAPGRHARPSRRPPRNPTLSRPGCPGGVAAPECARSVGRTRPPPGPGSPRLHGAALWPRLQLGACARGCAGRRISPGCERRRRYAVGHDVVFGPGRYNPAGPDGRRAARP